jgi:hypothetical protein
MFEIDETSGQISLARVIDDFNVMEFNLIVRASQADNQMRTAMSMVHVTVLDINKHPPKFDADLYETSVQENIPLDSPVCDVHATDADDNRLTYTLVNAHETPFAVDRRTGAITVSGRVDYEMRARYDLEAQVNDGVHTERAHVRVNVLNIVDKAPHFEYNFYNFKIKVPYDVYVGQIRATDVEATGNLTYRMAFGDSNDSALFCITQTGTIYLCSSILTPKSSESVAISPEDVHELIAQFKKDTYEFNVSVSIYSPDLAVELENHVECKIQIESKQLLASYASFTQRINSSGSNDRAKATKLGQSWQQPTRANGMPVMFMNEQMFKDATTVYVLIGVITGTLVVLLFCASVFMWLKCRKFSKKCRSRHRHRDSSSSSSSSATNHNSSHHSDDGKFSKKSIKAVLASKLAFDFLDSDHHVVRKTVAAAATAVTAANGVASDSANKLANSSGICSGSSNLSEDHHHCINITSSKDSTSSGVSCVSTCSNCSKQRGSGDNSPGLENHMFYSEWQNKLSNGPSSPNMLDHHHPRHHHHHRQHQTNVAANVQGGAKNNEQLAINDSSPISKITMLSEYVMESSNNALQQKHHHHHLNSKNSSNILKLNILKTSGESEARSAYPYSDMLSTSHGHLKNCETPILLRPSEYIYDVDERMSPPSASSGLETAVNGSGRHDSGHINKAYVTTFKMPASIANTASACCLPSGRKLAHDSEAYNNINVSGCVDKAANNSSSLLTTMAASLAPQLIENEASKPESGSSPKLLSFLPPSSGLNYYDDFASQHRQKVSGYLEVKRHPPPPNMLFNQQEPLSVSSETNFENTEFMKSLDKRSMGEISATTTTAHATSTSINSKKAQSLSSFMANQKKQQKDENNSSSSNFESGGGGGSRSEMKFHNHIENCNTSLVKLVSIIHSNNQSEEGAHGHADGCHDHGETSLGVNNVRSGNNNHDESTNDCNTEFIEDVDFVYDDSQLNYDPPDFSNDQVR